jgi:hypothetical protein
MSSYSKRQGASIQPILACLLSGLALVGCSNSAVKESSADATPSVAESSIPADNSGAIASPDSQNNPESNSDAQDWQTILSNQTAYGLTFTENGELVDQGKVLLPELVVGYISDGSVTYAERLIVSHPSPSGNFHFVKACDDPDSGVGLCWSVYLVNKAEAKAQQVGIGKYGGAEWVQWSEDEQYAVMIEQHDGASWFVAINAETGETALSEELPPNVDITSFNWVDDRTFHVDFRDCTTSTCEFTGNVEEILQQ